MSTLLGNLSAAAGANFWLDVSVKATVLMLAAVAATALLRRSSAALRHRVWSLTFAALLLLPGLSAALPEWRLAVLPAQIEEQAAPEANLIEAPQGVQHPIIHPTRNTFGAQAAFEAPASAELMPPAIAEAAPAPLENATPSEERPGFFQTAPRLPVLATLWLLGAGAAVSPVLIGSARVLVLRRRARPIADGGWAALLDELRARLGLVRRVDLLETDATVMPMTWGLLRPVVLLPSASHNWTAQMRRIVLLHELAHVKRYDVGFQLLARFATALYWFHPLAWYALRRIRIERELACDDCVVHAGERASDYAAELLAVARNYRPIPLAAAVAMAQRSNLEHRIRSLFDRACSHLPISARAARLLFAGMAILVTTIAAVRLAPRAAAEEEPEPQAAKDSRASADDAFRRVAVRVLDNNESPIPDARVRIVRFDTSRMWSEEKRLRVLSEARTDQTGSASIDFADSGRFATRESLARSTFYVLADAAGYAFVWDIAPPGGNVTLRLSSEDVPIEGRVLDLEGRPRKGVRVRAMEVRSGAKGDIDAWIEAAKHNPTVVDADDLASNQAPKIARFPSNNYMPLDLPSLLSATTDEEGRFRLAGLGRDRLLILELAGADMAKTWLNVFTRDMPPVPYSELGDPRYRVNTCFGAHFDLTTEPDQPITGIVQDAENGRPLACVEVRLNQYAGASFFVEGFLSDVTDGAGRYTLWGAPKPNHPKQGHRLRLIPPPDKPYFRTEADVARREGLDPATCDVKLKRAIWVRGRVTDATTGNPIPGFVAYCPFLSNQAASSYSNFNPGAHSLDFEYYAVHEDGSYLIPALPGRGVVAFTALEKRYPEGDGVESIADLRKEGSVYPNVYHMVSPESASALREINPPADAAEAVCDVSLHPLEVARVELIDSEGLPVTGAVSRRLEPVRMALGYNNGWSYAALPTATAEIIGPHDSTSRSVMFWHREQNLAGAALLSVSRNPPKQVILRTCAAITGRVVGRDNKPISDLHLRVSAAPEPDAKPAPGWARSSIYSWHELDAMTTDADGRFHVKSAPPGMSYVVWAQRGAEQIERTTRVIEPGETLELGDLVLQEPDESQAYNRQGSRSPEASDAPGASKTKPEDADREPTTSVAGSSAGAAPRSSETTVNGVVLDPAGKALPGARVYVRSAITEAADEPHTSTVTDANGRFQLSFRWPQLDERIQARPDMLVVAVADGYAADWEYLKDETPQDFTLRLRDEQALVGRIINAEGKPLAGVELSVKEIARYERDVMEQVLDDAEQGRTISRWYKDWRYGPLPGQPARVTTDADGRFRMAGLAADTVLKLHVRGAGIRHTTFEATTATPETIRGPTPPVEPPFPPQAGRVLYGSHFDYVAEPARNIQGVVRDRVSGRPVPGVKVHCWNATTAEAATDEAGRYILEGCGKRSRNVLSIDPPSGGPPYFPGVREIVDAPGLEPLVEDVELVEGIELSGRILDNDSGRPLVADVSYAPIHLNVHVDSLFEHEANLYTHSRSQPDGSFRIIVAPGPGVVSIGFPSVSPEAYLPMRVGFDDLVQLFEQSPEHRELARSPELKRGWPDALPTAARGGWTFVSQTVHARTVLISPDEQKRPEPLEVRLVRGRTLQGRLIAPDGQLPAGATAYGLDNGTIQSRLLSGADFTVTALAHGETREICFHHQKRKLGAFHKIAGDEAEPLAVRLVPDGGAQGRVLDEQGDPVEGLHVWFYRAGASTAEVYSITDAEGRFRTDNLIADQPYEATRSVAGGVSRRQLSPGKFTVGSGQTHDLGDLIVRGRVQTVSPQSRRKAAAGPAAAPTSVADATATTPSATNKVALRGQVLLPDGKPASGAAIYWPHFKSLPPQSPDDLEYTKRAETDGQGEFECSLNQTEIPPAAPSLWLIAHKPGFGIAWLDVRRAELPKDATLRLAEDRPISGRVTDTEGRPVKGARIAVNSVLASSNGSLDGFLSARKQRWQDAWSKLDRPLYAPLGSLVGAASDAEGRFTLSGVGAEQVVSVEIVARGYAAAVVKVVNRPGFDAAEYNQAALAAELPQMRGVRMIPRLVGPDFEQIAEAELTIRGDIFQGADRAPVAGANVSVSLGWGPSIWANADASGRYELRGLPRNQELLVGFRPPAASNLLARTLAVKAAPGEAAVDFDAELKPGVVVEGRVFDRETGRGLKSGVRFVPLPGNKFVNEPGYDLYKRSRVMESTDDEGRFRLMIIPGPGVLMAQVHEGGTRIEGKEINPYRQASFTEEERKRVSLKEDGDDRHFTAADNSLEFLSIEQAVKVIDLPPEGEPFACDLPVDPGKTLKMAIEDDQGQPLSNVYLAGLTESSHMAFRIAEATCTIYAIGADRPRRVCLLHPERRLAASLTLTGEEQAPVTIRLAPAATIKGQALDESGAPIADAVVRINYARENASELERFARLEHPPVKTDAEGRFRVENVVPGERFVLDFKQGDTYFRAKLSDEQRELKAGETLELDGVSAKQLRSG